MRDLAILRNSYSARLSDIPHLDVEKWRSFIIDSCQNRQGRVVSIFGVPENDSVKMFAVIGIDLKSELHVASCSVKGAYQSVTPELPQAHLFEREIYENFGVEPKGHPSLKPVRSRKGYKYFGIDGTPINEVAVGPVHAGVIEPGHFRFQCNGEKVFNLEIHLGYQHRGVEKLITSSSGLKQLILAESIAGDSSVANALAYCHTIEGFAKQEITQRARIIRTLAIEMERIANHVGDLGAIANDVGYLPAASYYGRLRAVFLNVLLRICGNRFGRGLLEPGGVRYDLKGEMAEEITRLISKAGREVEDVWELMMHSAGVVGRLEGTGVVSHVAAQGLGLVGVAARACNLQRDVRTNYPSGLYRFIKIVPVRATTGDVFARARVRFLETKRSMDLSLSILKQLPFEKLSVPSKERSPDSIVISLVEGWRGEICHIGITDGNGNVSNYKICDPSFHNWSALEVALKGEQISNFPLCNKSFNLSYAGFDL